MDLDKRRNEFIDHGYDVPDFDDGYRFGLRVVNESNAAEFLEHLKDHEVGQGELTKELHARYRSARSWWDVSDLFPIMFVDFDLCEMGAFYSEGVPMERYVPDGWTGRFVDFATEYPESVFPASSRFWIDGGADLLALLNQRGAGGG